MIKLSKRGLILFLLLLLLPVAVSAQEVTLSAYSAQADDTTSQTTKIRKKVGLVLSEGGQRVLPILELSRLSRRPGSLLTILPEQAWGQLSEASMQ